MQALDTRVQTLPCAADSEQLSSEPGKKVADYFLKTVQELLTDSSSFVAHYTDCSQNRTDQRKIIAETEEKWSPETKVLYHTMTLMFTTIVINSMKLFDPDILKLVVQKSLIEAIPKHVEAVHALSPLYLEALVKVHSAGTLLNADRVGQLMAKLQPLDTTLIKQLKLALLDEKKRSDIDTKTAPIAEVFAFIDALAPHVKPSILDGFIAGIDSLLQTRSS